MNKQFHRFVAIDGAIGVGKSKNIAMCLFHPYISGSTRASVNLSVVGDICVELVVHAFHEPFFCTIT